MSWSFQAVGRPSSFPAAIDRAVESYGPASDTNYSRREFEEAAPYLKALIALNSDRSVVRVKADGHANFAADGTKTSGSCYVMIEPLYGFIE